MITQSLGKQATPLGQLTPEAGVWSKGMRDNRRARLGDGPNLAVLAKRLNYCLLQ